MTFSVIHILFTSCCSTENYETCLWLSLSLSFPSVSPLPLVNLYWDITPSPIEKPSPKSQKSFLFHLSLNHSGLILMQPCYKCSSPTHWILFNSSLSLGFAWSRDVLVCHLQVWQGARQGGSKEGGNERRGWWRCDKRCRVGDGCVWWKRIKLEEQCTRSKREKQKERNETDVRWCMDTGGGWGWESKMGQRNNPA